MFNMSYQEYLREPYMVVERTLAVEDFLNSQGARDSVAPKAPDMKDPKGSEEDPFDSFAKVFNTDNGPVGVNG